MNVSVRVNGKLYSQIVDTNVLLCDFLRDSLGLTGTKVGCDTGQCGSCVVLLDGSSVKSCSKLACQVDGAEVVTVEGLAKDGKLNALQESFQDCHGTQCGFCTPGMLMSVSDLLQKVSNPSEGEVRRQLEGNICRCTGYQNVLNAVQDAVRKINSPT